MQDGKVEELISHEKRVDEKREENQRKMLQKKISRTAQDKAGAEGAEAVATSKENRGE